MHQRELMQKKNDWVLYAYIIQRLGGETSLEEIQVKLTAWKRRNANSRRISQVMAMHKNKGFEKIGEKWTPGVAGHSKFSSIWSFNGDLPEIDKRTKQHWEQKLFP